MAEGHAALVNPFFDAVGGKEAREYQGVRPDYPERTYEILGEVSDGPLRTAVDVGAGTGQFTVGLAERGLKVYAVEPSDAMRDVLKSQPWADGIDILPTSAENTGLPPDTADLVVWAQCSHWLDIPAAAAEAHRILRPGGELAVVANQMDVSVPWVHRLSRIMRSGDVVRRDRTPTLGPLFGPPRLQELPWAQELSVDECMALARTRSSYLVASETQRAKMQANLSWYLRDHLGYGEGSLIELPYCTYVWTAHANVR